jgi:hypothetical protein
MKIRREKGVLSHGHRTKNHARQAAPCLSWFLACPSFAALRHYFLLQEDCTNEDVKTAIKTWLLYSVRHLLCGWALANYLPPLRSGEIFCRHAVRHRLLAGHEDQ